MCIEQKTSMPQATEGECTMRPIVKLKTLAVAVALLAVGVMMHPHGASAQATVPAQKEWRMESIGNNCLGVFRGQVTQDTAVVVWACNHNPDQMGWTAGVVAPEVNGMQGVLGAPANAIVSWATPADKPNLCVGHADDGFHLVMVPCDGDKVVTWWQDHNGAQIHVFDNVTNVVQNGCLDAEHGPDTLAVIRACGDHLDQFWNFISADVIVHGF
jgi:hypothetical protein